MGAARPPMVLSDAKIKSLPTPTTGQVEYPDLSVPGLRVRVGVSGAKTFMLRKRVVGRDRNITLGRFSERFRLADARKQARQILSDVETKADAVRALPERQKRGSGGHTVRALWPAYKRAKSHLRNVREIERVFNRHILPEFGDRAADAITRSEITGFIDEIAEHAPVMARNVLGYFSAFYTWALPRLDRLPGNPCRDAGRPPAPKARDRVLSERELGALWHVLGDELRPFGPAIQLLILTGQRRNEVFEADGVEFDLEAKLWTIPKDRAKNGTTHLVPLSTKAASIVQDLLSSSRSEKLLPARGNWEAGPSGFSKAMTRIRAELERRVGEPVPHWTLHDLRRTMATGLQRIGVRLEVTESVLNHISGSRSGIVGVYQRHHYFEEKRAALNAWAKEVARLARIKQKG
ncbi:tyrosine-type recombinase/integrase [Sphingomonas sp. MMS24-J13]|uniref:tyrosine-type recombinase/integrase n=1 Tax=Sphingomonas sp. MMS24-J13 TaxID=3238686 RepID=UPI00384F83FF